MKDSKPHYLMLDGLRGVVALMVVLYHLFEAVAFAAGAPEQKMFHGFLAVDFFFILSGFVMGYAYDEKWDRMSVGGFFKRRLIRLHPMVFLGVVIGLVVFIAQGCVDWNGNTVPWSQIILCTALSLFLLPSPASVEVRGNTEIFPLNGTHWSLFLEYIGSILYALVLRKMKTSWLALWVMFAAVTLFYFGVAGPYGNIAYGWSSDTVVFAGGFSRMLFAYPAGLLMARIFRTGKRAELGGWFFVVAAAVLCLLLSIPSLSDIDIPYLKVYYEVLCVTVFFPLIVWFAACGKLSEGISQKTVSLLGDLSYPLYAVHYPFIYLYIGWINSDVHPFGQAWWATPLAITLICIAIAYISFRFYDKPLRKFLAK